MTESDWLTATDPTPMLEWLRSVTSERKLKLLAVASCRRLMNPLDDAHSLYAVEFGERHADNHEATIDVEDTFENAWSAWYNAQAQGSARVKLYQAAYGCAALPRYEGAGWITESLFAPYTPQSRPSTADQLAWCSLVRCVFGNPFGPSFFDPSWRTSTVLALATQMYASRDFTRVPILADALQDAGSPDDSELIRHCRAPGRHVRGCHVLDIILQKT